MTGETEAIVTYALLSSILGFYAYSRISSLIELKNEIRRKVALDSEE